MSQTLSLPPGKYSLFITPPVAGVDFTGSPTPSVSYQWRKNGTAIAGQDAATISGVWVEQSGGTVDLVDGDTISIDIILTNPVQVTTKTVSAVIDASIPAPVISPISIRLASAPTTPVSTVSNSSIGSQIMVASTDAVNVVTTPPLLPTYQWRRGFAPIAGANLQTYTLQAADADSIIDCVVSVTNAGGTASSTASVIVGTVADAGWTSLTPALDSRLVYVSNDGNDAAAAAVHGLGYYLPSDEEIGADPTNPAGDIIAYKTFAAAKARMRSNPNLKDFPGSPQYPDWMLFRRGDTFLDVENLPEHGVQIGGRSNEERRVYTAWGDTALPRPVIQGGIIICMAWGDRGGNNISFVSLDLPNSNIWAEYGASNILIEDCRTDTVDNIYHGIALDKGELHQNVVVRRCVIRNATSSGPHVQGMWVSHTNGNVVIEECVFDRNGYKENLNNATTWTAKVTSAQEPGQLPAGTGVQPARTYFDRSIYASGYGEFTIRGNIFSRGGGGSSVQMGQGGICERNLFIWNQMALTTARGSSSTVYDAIVKDNVVLHDDHMLPPGGSGSGIQLMGKSDDTHVGDGNVVAHFHRGSAATTSITARGKGASSGSPQQKLLKTVIVNNAIYQEDEAPGIVIEPTTHDSAKIDGTGVGVLNAVVQGNVVSAASYVSMQGDPSKPATYTYSNNRFHSASTTPFRWAWNENATNGFDNDWRTPPNTNGTFSQWQAAGYDTDGTFATDFAAFRAAVGWTAPERDIVSYMQWVDSEYVVNEDVYVDEESAVKQATRQKVWEVLANADLAGNAVMTEARAKLTARRYHAFITFIQRAKENRKGAWDPRWTAEAVSNYIREGFGKPAVTGAYDTRSLADRILDYTT